MEWHEVKLGVFYRHEQAVRARRGELLEKVVVSWQGEGLELGRRLHWEALRGGLGRARDVLVVADGAPWIWNVVTDRWAGAHQLLDFYHASQHLWALGEALHPKDEAARRRWVEARLHRLRHGQEQAVLAELAALPRRRGAVGKVVQREQNYFAGHAGRMNYRGWPTRLADRQRRGGVGLSNATVSAQAPRTVLDARGFASLGCLGRSSRQRPLGRTLAHGLMVQVSNCALMNMALKLQAPKENYHCWKLFKMSRNT